MTNEQIFIGSVFAGLMLWWSVSTGNKAVWIWRIGWTLCAAFIIFAIYRHYTGPMVMFSNDGPLGSIVAARTLGRYWTDEELQTPRWPLKFYWIPIVVFWWLVVRNPSKTE